MENTYTHPLAYVIVQAQVDRVQGYDEDQVALIVPDESKFAEEVPIILGTPTISHIMDVMKEKGNRCLGNAMGEHQGGTSFICALSCLHNVGRPDLRKCQSKWV